MGQEIFRRDSRLICGGQSFYGADIGSSSTNELYLENGNNRLRWSRGGNLYQSVASFDVGSTSEPNNSMWTSVEDGIRRLYVARGGRKITMSHLQNFESANVVNANDLPVFFGNSTYNFYYTPDFPSGFTRLLLYEITTRACISGIVNTDINVVDEETRAFKRNVFNTSTICSDVVVSGGLTSSTPVAYLDVGESLECSYDAETPNDDNLDARADVLGWFAPSTHYVNAPIFQ